MKQKIFFSNMIPNVTFILKFINVETCDVLLKSNNVFINVKMPTNKHTTLMKRITRLIKADNKEPRLNFINLSNKFFF